MFRKKIIFILFSFIFPAISIAENSSYGILFRSSADLIDNRTSLGLFQENPLKVDNAISLSFDLSLWDIKQFGYIVRLINQDNQEISLVFVNFRGENNLYLDLNSSITNKSIQIPLEKKQLDERIWMKIQIEINTSEDKIHFYCNDKLYDLPSVGLKKADKLALYFGFHGLNLDVPRMAIRNILIKQKDEVKYVFPLNELEGESVHDKKGRVLGSVKNPDWIINRHFNWEKEAIFRSECTAGITYDDIKNTILIVNKDSITTYNPQSSTKSDIKIKHIPFTIYSGEAFYQSDQEVCYVYNLKQENIKDPSFAKINMKNDSMHLGHGKLDNALHHHNAFFVNDSLYIFGGYGNFSYSNNIHKYNAINDRWDTIKTCGDHIKPRFFSAIGDGRSSAEKLIFGGFGNQSGKQELGGRNLYDLFSLNTKTMTFKKIWELQDIQEIFVPCNNLICDKKKKYFYTLCYPHHLAKTKLQLYRFCIADGSYEIVSSPIAFLSEKINSRVYLFYNNRADKFYAVVREYIDDVTSEIRIYSLFAPPVDVSKLNNYPKHSFLESPYMYLLGILLFLCIGALFFSFRKKKVLDEPVEIQEKKILLPEVCIQKNAIYSLGDFLVFDHKGTNITYRFSSKLRALFALILLNTNGEETGISTEKLTADLWPDRDIAEAKNIRGVTINHLRSILMDIEGIELIHKNSRWHFSFGDPFYCDYIRSMQLMNSGLSERKEEISRIDNLLLIIKRGKLLPGLQTDWIDVYKRDYETLTENYLLGNINFFYEKEKFREVIKFSEIFFVMDPLDQEVLTLYVKSLRKLGKIKQSQTVYENFCKHYKLSMGEEYSHSYAVISN